MPFLPNSEKTTKPNFHFVGTEGKKLITFINTKKIDIEN